MEFQLIDAFIYAMDRLALAVVIGSGAAGAWLIVDNDQRTIATKTLQRLIETALPLLMITTLTVLLLRTAALADVAVSETAPYILEVVTGGGFGTLWLGRVAVLLLLITVWLLARRQITPTIALLLFAGGAMTAFFISGASHAGDEGLLSVDNIINSAHIVGGCLWGGAIIAYLDLLKRMDQLPTPVVAASAVRLSTVATVALVMVLASGFINGWNRLDELSQLWSTGYGITLLIKLVFVAAMMSLGAFNRFHLVPAVGRAQAGATQLLRRVLYMDATLVLLVIGAAAALAMQSPEHY